MGKAIVVLTFALLFAGCGSSAPIQRVSDSQSNFGSVFKGETTVIRTDKSGATQYRVFSQGGSGFVPISAERSDDEQRANEFCKQENKIAMTLSEQMSTPPYILGNFPKMEIIFICVENSNSASNTATVSSPGKQSAIDKLKELDSMHKQGLITDSEYASKKQDILKSM